METQRTEKNQQAVRSEQEYGDLIEELISLIGDGLGNLALVARVLCDDQFYSQVCTLKAEDQGGHPICGALGAAGSRRKC